ncbi:F-box/LRR-repeat protein 20 [Vitis vinifera]|uniref:F-box/LRR-repeat protein 20 n=1 Tax=Vitis vinifera TaxID=29760 RepID=A0A438K583_VITVI|nr:F-box/LRR-repeat protein 20 [Vitis vinifera]
MAGVEEASGVCINEALTDDELRAVLAKLQSDKDKEVFGLVCKRWLHLQSTEEEAVRQGGASHASQDGCEVLAMGSVVCACLACSIAEGNSLLEMYLHYQSNNGGSLLPDAPKPNLLVSHLGNPGYMGLITETVGIKEAHLDEDLRSHDGGLKRVHLMVLSRANSLTKREVSSYVGFFGGFFLIGHLDYVCLGDFVQLHECEWLKDFVVLIADEAGITDVGLMAIGRNLSHLQSLDVSYCRKLTDKGLSAIAESCCDLRSLHLAGCRSVNDKVLEALSKNCHNLEELGLQGCTYITDSGLTFLVKGCQRMKFLDINKCSNISDIGVCSVSISCSCSLKTLKLLDCYKVGDESVLSLAQFCKNLETLIIGGCREHSDENLEALDIGCCEEVTDAAFQGLNKGGSKLGLKVLKVSNCPKITVAGIGLLLDSCNSLEYLDVRSCPHVTEAGCDQAGLQFPECCKVNFLGSLSEPDVLV